MQTKSKKSALSKSLKVPKFTRGTYQKNLVHVPAPDNLPDIDPNSIYGLRFVTQERAREITGKSANIVRRWATNKQPIDVTSLQLLQVWIWGLVPSDLFTARGIRVCYQHPDFPDAHGAPACRLELDSPGTEPLQCRLLKITRKRIFLMEDLPIIPGVYLLRLIDLMERESKDQA